jgi:hypothetical protein
LQLALRIGIVLRQVKPETLGSRARRARNALRELGLELLSCPRVVAETEGVRWSEPLEDVLALTGQPSHGAER